MFLLTDIILNNLSSARVRMVQFRRTHVRRGRERRRRPVTNAGLKRPSVIRAVDKTRRRKRRRVDSDEESLDDWMVEDDEIVDDEDRYVEEEEDFFQGLNEHTNQDADTNESSSCGALGNRGLHDCLANGL